MTEESRQKAHPVQRVPGQSDPSARSSGNPSDARKVTLAEHRLMAKHKIAIRESDGKWGFKLKCAWEGCNELVENCYCADTLEAALERVQKRANWYHSNRCVFRDGMAEDGFSEVHDIFKPKDRAYAKKAGVDLTKPGWGVKVAENDALWKRLRGAIEDEMMNWDNDGDEEACSCEV